MTVLYKLLNDERMLREASWLISLHLEKFDCKDSLLPCYTCRTTADKLAPLFLIGIEGIANKTSTISRTLAKAALEKMSEQKWQLPRPWKQVTIPIPRDEAFVLPVVSSKSLFDDDKETKKTVTYRLMKRHKDAL